jgi:hypothetical protein
VGKIATENVVSKLINIGIVEHGSNTGHHLIGIFGNCHSRLDNLDLERATKGGKNAETKSDRRSVY